MKNLSQEIYDSGYVNGAEEGVMKGKTQGKAEVAKALLMTGELSIESISNATGISVEELTALKAEMKA